MQFSPLTSVTPSGACTNVTSSTLLRTGGGELVGVIVNSHTSGTIRFSDALTSTTPYMGGTITLATSGTYDRFIPFFGARFYTGLYITTGGTVDLTVVWNAA